MTIKERKEQLRYRKAIVMLIIINIICWIPFGVKYFGCSACVPTAGVTAALMEMQIEAIENPQIEEEVVEIVEETDITCSKKYSATEFRKLGRVKYEGHTFTFYSEKVLPGGGLKIEGRHNELIDGLPFVCNVDGYIVVACDFLPRGSIVNTCVGRQGIVLDCGAGSNNIDLYVGW